MTTWPKHHDPLCMPGLKGNDSSMCPWCLTIRAARTEERTQIANMLDALDTGLREITRRLRGEPPMPDA